MATDSGDFWVDPEGDTDDKVTEELPYTEETPYKSGQGMRVIDLLKAMVDLPIDLLREACRVNPDAEVITEGCDCFGEVAWVEVAQDGDVRLLREIPPPIRCKPPRTWYTRDGRKVQALHPEAFVEITDEWTTYFQTRQWPPTPEE